MALNSKEKEAVAYAATLVGGAAAILGSEAASERRKNKRHRKLQEKSRERVQARREKTSQGRNQARKAAAETRLTQLQRIRPSDLSKENRKVRTAYIQEQKNILKDLKPKTATSIAKSIGLKAIPGLTAFLTAFSSSPAYQQGGRVHRGRKADGSKA
jgi:Flp pilus assembly protein TadB